MSQQPDKPRPPQMGAMSISFHQDGDSCNSADQMLEIVIEDAGGGSYFVLTADRWAVDDPSDIADLLGEVKRRLGDWWTEASCNH